MGKAEKILQKLAGGGVDANFAFDDLCFLLQRLGYTIRSTKSSHVIFQKAESFFNLQNDGGKAKAYQVRQVRDELKRLKIVL